MDSELKPGIKTTEFWLAILTSLFFILNKVFHLYINANELAAILAPVVAYIISRAYVKSQTGGQK